MTSFYSQSISSIKSPHQIKKSFQIIKGRNDMISQIKGISNNEDPNIYHITSNMKQYNKNTGIIHSKHKSYRLKSSEILNLFKDSSKYKDENHKEEPINHVKSIKTSKKKSISKSKKVDSDSKISVTKLKKKVSDVKIKDSKPKKKVLKVDINPIKKYMDKKSSKSKQKSTKL